MRTYIFTERERKIIETYIESGKRLEGFNQLDHRLRSAWPRLVDDLVLVLRLGAVNNPFLKEYVAQIEKLQDWLGKHF